MVMGCWGKARQSDLLNPAFVCLGSKTEMWFIISETGLFVPRLVRNASTPIQRGCFRIHSHTHHLIVTLCHIPPCTSTSWRSWSSSMTIWSLHLLVAATPLMHVQPHSSFWSVRDIPIHHSAFLVCTCRLLRTRWTNCSCKDDTCQHQRCRQDQSFINQPPTTHHITASSRAQGCHASGSHCNVNQFQCMLHHFPRTTCTAPPSATTTLLNAKLCNMLVNRIYTSYNVVTVIRILTYYLLHQDARYNQRKYWKHRRITQVHQHTKTRRGRPRW